MFETVLGPFIIGALRVCDVSIGTFRTIMVVQGKKYQAGAVGFLEALIWVNAISIVFAHLSNPWNILGYATGYAIGNIVGIWLEQKIGMGFVQITVISLKFSEEIAEKLRAEQYGITKLPAEGLMGNLNMIFSIVERKKQRKVIDLIESIDPKAFISVQSSLPYRGFVQGSRK